MHAIIGRQASETPIDQEPSMTPMEKMFDSARALPSIPRVLQEVLATLNKKDVEISEITTPLQKDPALSAKVLRLANAAHFGLQKKVVGVDDAVTLVGLDAVRTLVIASGLIGSFTAIPGFDMGRFWKIGLLASYIAKDLARKVRVDPETSYTAALMHGLGVLSIHAVFPELALSIDEVCKDQSASDRATVEHDKLGFHHGEVGAEIAARWKLPDTICSTIRYYVNPLEAGAPKTAAVVHAAINLAIDIEDGVPVDEWGKRLQPEIDQMLAIDWDAIRYKEAYFRGLHKLAQDAVA